LVKMELPLFRLYDSPLLRLYIASIPPLRQRLYLLAARQTCRRKGPHERWVRLVHKHSQRSLYSAWFRQLQSIALRLRDGSSVYRFAHQTDPLEPQSWRAFPSMIQCCCLPPNLHALACQPQEWELVWNL